LYQECLSYPSRQTHVRGASSPTEYELSSLQLIETLLEINNFTDRSKQQIQALQFGTQISEGKAAGLPEDIKLYIYHILSNITYTGDPDIALVSKQWS